MEALIFDCDGVLVDTEPYGHRVAFNQVFAGDIAAPKKPDPAVYLLAAERLALAHNRCVVVEDSNNGLRAALRAGMRCVITTSSYTEGEDFSGTSLVVPELGDHPSARIDLATLQTLCRN